MDAANRTLVCSVLFLDIVQYSTMPVAEQLEAKQGFNKALAAALEQVAPRDRVILDTGDGAAVTFMGDPEDALFAAIAMRELTGTVPIRLGVNLGPVRLVKDLNGRINILGDGINVAQRVMSFAHPGQLLVSRSFYEVVSCLSRDYGRLFQREGSRTDKHVREHEVYSVLSRPREEPIDKPRVSRPPSAASRLRLAALAGTLAVVSMAALMVHFQAGGFQSIAGTVQARPQPVRSAVARSVAAQTLASLDARIEVRVSPWGEIVVDGHSRGMSPPAQVLSLAPGRHTVEIRNSSYPIHVERVEVKPGQALHIDHTFY